jgi:hypothetical protein
MQFIQLLLIRYFRLLMVDAVYSDKPIKLSIPLSALRDDVKSNVIFDLVSLEYHDPLKLVNRHSNGLQTSDTSLNTTQRTNLKTRLAQLAEKVTQYVLTTDVNPPEPKEASEMFLANFVNKLLASPDAGDTFAHNLSAFISGEPDKAFCAMPSTSLGYNAIETITGQHFENVDSSKLIYTFQMQLNSVFFLMTEQETENLLNGARYQQNAPRSIFCQLCMVFALGEQLCSSPNRSKQVFWFENARRILDEALEESEHNELWVIRVFLMISLYYLRINVKAAKPYLGTILLDLKLYKIHALLTYEY